jgi:hypothetical protein
MRSNLAIAGVVCVGALALGGGAQAQISQFLQQPKPILIDDRAPRTQELGPAPTSRFFTAAQLRCTLRSQNGTHVIHFVFTDPSGKTPNYKIETGESDIRTGTITNARVENGERRFTIKGNGSEWVFDLAVKMDGSIALTRAQRGDETRQLTMEGGCNVVTGAAEPERPSTPPATPERPRTTVLNTLAADCAINDGDHDHKIEIMFRSEDGTIRPSFYEPAKRKGEGFVGDVRNDRTTGDARRFTLVFASGLEVDYTLTADGRLTAGEARRDGRRGTMNLHGSCQVVS